MRLAMRWSADAQWMEVDGERYAHEGATITYPSHDLCHLVVAAHANPKLYWHPTGRHDAIKLAEYFAVGVEKLYRNVRYHLSEPWPDQDVPSAMANDVKLHQEWYGGDYQHPFPINQVAALQRLTGNVRDDLLVRFFPAYVTAFAMENRAAPPGDHPPITASFTDTTTFPTDDMDRKGQALVVATLKELRRLAG